MDFIIRRWPKLAAVEKALGEVRDLLPEGASGRWGHTRLLLQELLGRELYEWKWDPRSNLRPVSWGPGHMGHPAVVQVFFKLVPSRLLDDFVQAARSAAEGHRVAVTAQRHVRHRTKRRPDGTRKSRSREGRLPAEGAKFREQDVPAAFREGGKSDGAVLTASYLEDNTNWLLNGPYLTKHYGEGKELTKHIKVGRLKAYLYAELLVLRDRKRANEEEREGRR
jgi:hypothetical protein